MTNPRSARNARVRGEARLTLAHQLRADYEAGSSIRGIAERTGWSYGAVRNLLLIAGTVLRRRGKGRRRAPQ